MNGSSMKQCFKLPSMALNARHSAKLRVLGGTQWWQPLAELFSGSLGIAPEVLREAPPFAAVASTPLDYQETNGVTVRKVVDCLLPGKRCSTIFRPGGSGATGKELDVTYGSLANRQLSTSAGGAQLAECSTEVEEAVFHRNCVATSDGANPPTETDATGDHHPEHASGRQSLDTATASSGEEASISCVSDVESVGENEDEVGCVTAESANSASDEGEEETEQLERTFAEVVSPI